MTVITGFHAVEELVRSGRKKGTLLVSQKGPRVKAILEAAQKAGIRAQNVSKDELDRIAPDNRGVAFRAEGDDAAPETRVDLREWLSALESKSVLVLILDHIQDPHNYGAVLRSADQFGASLVIVPNRRAAKETETVARSSAGASAWVPVAEVSNLSRAAELLKEAGFWVWACDMDGSPAWDADLTGRVAIVLGSEGPGVSRVLRDVSDGAISLPSAGKVDSLNVSVAAGVFMYEWARRAAKGK